MIERKQQYVSSGLSLVSVSHWLITLACSPWSQDSLRYKARPELEIYLVRELGRYPGQRRIFTQNRKGGGIPAYFVWGVLWLRCFKKSRFGQII